ncbi:hypothetical protein GCM10025867_46160 (plasmid) [Frondihabitans sucicola]|uniref:Peptidyl-tRNA hydrolase n=1 Tax=Frondihabitans sucicola TaxID=1268041 RepID=A0ABN6Y4X4_9MICO|nr:hypothetical protein [Frondihabitans sucicola]BDZ52375.1 hypothetical protein GCM10025867_46160 [Frondihabitans sucicola]
MTDAPTDELKMRILVNTGAKMSRGKYAAQAVHAALIAVGAHPGTPVVVLGGSREQIEALPTQVRDAGRTEVEPGTLTAGTNWAPEVPQATPSNVIAALTELEQWAAATGSPVTRGVILDALKALGAATPPSMTASPLLSSEYEVGPSPFTEGQPVRYVGTDPSMRQTFQGFKLAAACPGNDRFTLVNFNHGMDARDVPTSDLVATEPCGTCGSSNNNGMACFFCGSTDADG